MQGRRRASQRSRSGEAQVDGDFATSEREDLPDKDVQKPKQHRRTAKARIDEPRKGKDGAQGSAENTSLEAESDEGNVEYKLRLKQPNPIRFQQLVTQLTYRLSEGSGECWYYLGVEDNGYPRGLNRQDLEQSIQTLTAMTEAAGAALQTLQEMPATDGRSYLIAKVVRLCRDELSYTDLRIAVAGSVDSGKSTLVAVMTHGQKGRPLLDDGHGSARMTVLRHKHEIETGRTSSLSQHTLAYDSDARVLNYAGVAPMTPAETAAAASKVLRFVDLGGHQKYLKTALYGMTSLLPDFLLLCVCPLIGLTRAAREHFAAAQALEVPLAIILTKADIVPAVCREAALEELCSLLLAASSRNGHAAIAQGRSHLPYVLVKSETQANEVARIAGSKLRCLSNQIPIIEVASTTGLGLSVLHSFLSQLKPELSCCTEAGPQNLQAGLAIEPHDSQPFAEDATLDPDAAGGAQSAPSNPASLSSSGNLAGLADTNGTALDSSKHSQALPLAALPFARGFQSGSAASSTVPAHFQVDHTFEVHGVGSVVSGTLVAGSIVVNQRLLLGPSDTGHFSPITVTSIQRSQVAVRRIRAGQHATLAICPNLPAGELSSPAGSLASSSQLAAPFPEAESVQAQAAKPAGPSQRSSTDRRHDTWREQVRAASAGGAILPSAALSEEGLTPSALVEAPQLVGASDDEAAPEWAEMAGGSPSTRRSCEGNVLLDLSLKPHAVWKFQAVMVLLSGFWPPRGLLSGSWPPQTDVDKPSISSASPGRLSSPSLSHQSKYRYNYTPVVHCGSVRQAASVISMSETSLCKAWHAPGANRGADHQLQPAVSAAASLTAPTASGDGSLTESCVAVVTLQFLHRAEWLCPGSKLVVRDRTESCIAGAGFVQSVLFE